jgi:hypothetical protein
MERKTLRCSVKCKIRTASGAFHFRQLSEEKPDLSLVLASLSKKVI